MCVRVCVCVIYTCPCDGVIYQNDTYLISQVFLQPPPSSHGYNTSNNNFFTHFHSFFISFLLRARFGVVCKLRGFGWVLPSRRPSPRHHCQTEAQRFAFLPQALSQVSRAWFFCSFVYLSACLCLSAFVYLSLSLCHIYIYIPLLLSFFRCCLVAFDIANAAFVVVCYQPFAFVSLSFFSSKRQFCSLFPFTFLHLYLFRCAVASL